MRYRNHTIEETPTENYPELVTITKGANRYGLVGRKYITTLKAKLAIDTAQGESVVMRTPKQIKADLEQTIPMDYSEDYQNPTPLKNVRI